MYVTCTSLSEEKGLEPLSPYGQRFSSPLAALSRNVAYQPRISLLADQGEERDFRTPPVIIVRF